MLRYPKFFEFHNIERNDKLMNFLLDFYNKSSNDIYKKFLVDYYDLEKAIYQDQFGVGIVVLNTFMCHPNPYLDEKTVTLSQLLSLFLYFQDHYKIGEYLKSQISINDYGDIQIVVKQKRPLSNNWTQSPTQTRTNPLFNQGGHGRRTQSMTMHSRGPTRTPFQTSRPSWIKSGRKVVTCDGRTRSVYVHSKTGEERIRRKSGDAFKFFKFSERDEKKKDTNDQKKSSTKVIKR